MISALLGGAIIGIAVSLMLSLNGRVTGISGIIGNLFSLNKKEISWRMSFIGGLMVGGVILFYTHPSSFIQESHALKYDYIIAGLLVGFGTLLGNGCTSGHGVCGISRFSKRSIIATLTFIFFGALSVILFKFLRGEL